MSELTNALFPVPEQRRNSDDMGLPSPRPSDIDAALAATNAAPVEGGISDVRIPHKTLFAMPVDIHKDGRIEATTNAAPTPDDRYVICPNCAHQFQAISVSDQLTQRELERERDAIKETAERNKWMCEVMQTELADLKAAIDAAGAELPTIGSFTDYHNDTIFVAEDVIEYREAATLAIAKLTQRAEGIEIVSQGHQRLATKYRKQAESAERQLADLKIKMSGNSRDYEELLADARHQQHVTAVFAEKQREEYEAEIARLREDAAMWKDAYYGSAPSGAKLRCRKCGDLTEIEFQYAAIDAARKEKK